MPHHKTQNVKVQNLERDLARRALVSEAPEASQGPKGPIWRVYQKLIWNIIAVDYESNQIFFSTTQ